MSRITKAVLGVTCAVVAVHVAMRLGGLGEHASVLAGMPRSSLSIVIGPVYVLSYFASVIVAPIVAFAAGFSVFLRRA